ncbi:MAG: hypothetical protein UY96_C0028G0003 [Parcubacteria group bacterium GW2011_GWB1_56_8]|nr:MAG: hypothetical protein UY96_C0028G0003 [Parcubacteria group bacterium GW2011_GWB1_56_8]
MAKRYQLTVTEAQAAAIEWSCELAARLSIGQVHEILTQIAIPRLPAYSEESETRIERAQLLLNETKSAIWPELALDASYSISSPEVPDRAKDALDVMAQMRYVRLKECEAVYSSNIWSNPPTQVGSGPLPSVYPLDALAFAVNEAKKAHEK